MIWLWSIGLIFVSLVGVAISVFRLPGTWLILGAATLHSWYHGWSEPGWEVLVALAVVAVLAEVFEAGASAVAVQRSGASRKAIWGAMIGGFLGMFVFSIPLPVIGTLIGGALGCFIGAVVAEMSQTQQAGHAARVGAIAAAGQITGAVLKIMLTVVMFVTVTASVVIARFNP